LWLRLRVAFPELLKQTPPKPELETNKHSPPPKQHFPKMVQGRYDQLSADILTQREQERLAQRLEKLNKVTVPATTTTSTWYGF